MLSIHPDLATQEAPRATIEQALKSAIGRTFGLALFGFVGLLWVSVASWSVSDPSLTHATSGETRNLLGAFGAIVSDLLLQAVGFATLVVLVVPMFWALELTFRERVQRLKSKLILYPLSVLVLAGGLSALPVAGRWPLHHGYGGMLGDGIYAAAASLLAAMSGESGGALAGLALFAAGFAILSRAVGISLDDLASFRSRIAGTDAAHAVSPPSLPPIQGMVPPREDLARGVGLAIGVARHTAHRGHSILKTGARGLQDGLMHGFAGAQDRWSRAAQGLAAHAERAAHAAQTHPHAAGPRPAAG
ncbi:MAG: DNA translocase FtsK 4TM domain-containing protein, partial [Hyphomicrobiaceae bacterium]